MDVRSRSKRPVYADVVETQRAIRSVKHANLKASVGLAIFGSALAYSAGTGTGPPMPSS